MPSTGTSGVAADQCRSVSPPGDDSSFTTSAPMSRSNLPAYAPAIPSDRFEHAQTVECGQPVVHDSYRAASACRVSWNSLDGLLDDLRHRLHRVDAAGDLAAERERGVEVAVEVERQQAVERRHRDLLERLCSRASLYGVASTRKPGLWKRFRNTVPVSAESTTSFL